MINIRKYILCLVAGILFILALASCRSEKRQNNISMDIDSSAIKLKYANELFTIPSPNQTLFLIRKNNINFDSEIPATENKPEKYSTTFKKSIILGVWGADICYLNLYCQKEYALHYMNNIKKMIEDLDISKPFQPEFFKRLEENFGNNDSVLNYVSELYRRCDEYLKYNDRADIGVLIITGGWLESFYILTKLYTETKNNKLFTLILYQKEVIDNLIKILSPLYHKNPEYKVLIDDITNIAYEFDILDTKDYVIDIYNDSLQKMTTVHNETKFILSGSQLNNLSSLIFTLREKYLY
jgi:hypothetical protein